MNVRIDKPIRKGETRHGVLSREMNGVVCFDETNQWLNKPKGQCFKLKEFPKYGTRVTRKRDQVIIKQIVPVAQFDVFENLGRADELTEAVCYVSQYVERRKV